MYPQCFSDITYACIVKEHTDIIYSESDLWISGCQNIRRFSYILWNMTIEIWNWIEEGTILPCQHCSHCVDVGSQNLKQLSIKLHFIMYLLHTDRWMYGLLLQMSKLWSTESVNIKLVVITLLQFYSENNFHLNDWKMIWNFSLEQNLLWNYFTVFFLCVWVSWF